MVLNPQSSKLNIISILVTDVSLLIIMLAGLFRLRSRRDGTSGLGHLLWKQVSFWTVMGTLNLHSCSVRKGVIWLFVATVAEVTPAVSPINLSCTFSRSF